MSKRNVKSTEEKLKIVNLYLEKGKSISSLIREYGVSDTTIRTWVRKYKHLGIAGLRESKTWTRYSKEIKEQAVQDYLSGRGSLETIIETYHISSGSVLEKPLLKNVWRLLTSPLLMIRTIRQRLRNMGFPTNKFIPG